MEYIKVNTVRSTVIYPRRKWGKYEKKAIRALSLRIPALCSVLSSERNILQGVQWYNLKEILPGCNKCKPFLNLVKDCLVMTVKKLYFLYSR